MGGLRPRLQDSFGLDARDRIKELGVETAVDNAVEKPVDKFGDKLGDNQPPPPLSPDSVASFSVAG